MWQWHGTGGPARDAARWAACKRAQRPLSFLTTHRHICVLAHARPHPPAPRQHTHARTRPSNLLPAVGWAAPTHLQGCFLAAAASQPIAERTAPASCKERGGRGVICRHTSPPGRAARRAPGSRVRLRCMGAEVVRCAARRRVRALTGTGRARPRRTPLRARWWWRPAPRAGRLAASRSSSRALCCRC